MTSEFYLALLSEIYYVSILGAYHFTLSYVIVQECSQQHWSKEQKPVNNYTVQQKNE